MTIERINKYLDECMRFNFIDLFYVYCGVRGVDDPENDLTEEEYAEMEKKCEETITYDLLRNLVEQMTGLCNEEIYWTMERSCNE